MKNPTRILQRAQRTGTGMTALPAKSVIAGMKFADYLSYLEERACPIQSGTRKS